MTWVRIGSELPEDPRWESVGAAGLGLHVAALAYCNRNLTDGVLPLSRARRLLQCPDVDDVIDRLVAAGFWRRDQDGDDVEIADYHECQPSAEKVREARRLKAERQARWLERKRGDASAGASRDASRDGGRDNAPPPTPPPHRSAVVGGGGAGAPQGSPPAPRRVPKPLGFTVRVLDDVSGEQ